MMEQLETYTKVFAALAVLEGESDPPSLFRFAPPTLEEKLIRYAELLARRFSRSKSSDLIHMLRSWRETSPALPTHEIHPGWVLEAIRGESPRVVGLVCRYLPGSHVRYIIKHLPKETRDKLPSLSESFGVPKELIEPVKEFLSQKFFSAKQPSSDQTFSCQHIPWMNSKDLRRMIRELGYAEIRKAFSQVDPKVVRTFLTRFSLEEAKRVRRHIEQGPPVLEADRTQAQKHIVSMDLDVGRAEELPFELGLSVLAECVRAEESEWIEGVIVRLEPSEGYVLRRHVREALGRERKEDVERRKSELLGLIRDLADRGQIARYWRSSFEEETTKSKKAE